MEGGRMVKGEMPEEWEMVRLGEVSIFIRDGTHTPPKRVTEGVPLLSARNITNSRIVRFEDDTYITENEYQKIHSKYEIQKGDVLLTIVGTIGNTVVANVNYKFTLQRSVAIIRPDENKLSPYFLHLIFQSANLKKQILGYSKTTTQAGIYLKELNGLRLPLPPLPEQRRIAEVLGTVDGAIQKVGGAIETTERLKKGLMQRLLTRGIGHERFKESEFGRTPEEWELLRLGDIADDFIGGGTPSTSNPNYWNGKIAWMTSAHISGRIVTSGQRYITEKGLIESSTHLISKGNLLVATRVGIGKAAINSIDVAISQDLTGVIIKKDKASVDYVYWFLLNNPNKLKSLAQGSTIKGLLKNDLANLKLPLPPLSEQRRIAEILSATDKKLELERRRKEKLERVKKGLMNELLTGRKRLKEKHL